jgi:hypothetical protein
MKCFSLSLLLALGSCASGPGPITPQTPVERQMIGLLEKFDRWDEDGNGKLTAPELKDAQKRSGRTPAKIIGFYDTNGDQAISLREAQAGFSRVEEAEKNAKR